MPRSLTARILAVLIMLVMLLCGVSVSAETTLTDDELSALRLELGESQEDESFLVLPDDYKEPVGGLDGQYNLLLIGIDTDTPNMRGRSDTMILASLDSRAHKLRMISFMRDLYVSIPGRGHNKLNAAYAFGGPDLLIKTLDKSFGVRVDGYVAVNFSGMIELVDAIGGIPMHVEERELRPLNGILEYYNYQRGVPGPTGRLEKAGDCHLTGLQTMSYARIRKIDSDYERVERQQRVMRVIFDKMMKLSPSEIVETLGTYATKVATDVTMGVAMDLAYDLVNMNAVKVESLRIPVKGSMASKLIREAYFIVPNLQKNQVAIQDFLRGE